MGVRTGMAVMDRDELGRKAAAAANVGAARLGRIFSAGAAPRIAEAALVVVAAVLLARLALSLFAPLPVPETPATPAPPRAEAAVAPEMNPFAPLETEAVALAAAPVAAETTLDLTLHGTWIDGGEGTAIIRTPDQMQKIYRVGDPICCGATLTGVYPGQVIISRVGVQESLRLPGMEGAPDPGPAPAPAPVDAPPPSAEGVDGAYSGGAVPLNQIVRFQPVERPDGVRFALLPAGDPAAFAALGLQEGDILLSINGAPAPSAFEGLAAAVVGLAGFDRITVGVERNGTPQNINIQLPSDS